jgi:hypothetical protein
MPVRAIVTGITIIIILVLTVFCVEFFVPLSAKIEMNICCRNALLSMEAQGELTGEKRQSLNDRLASAGFEGNAIEASSEVMYGEEINLHVEASYTYKKFTGLFSREDVTQCMIYDRTAISRRVVN